LRSTGCRKAMKALIIHFMAILGNSLLADSSLPAAVAGRLPEGILDSAKALDKITCRQDIERFRRGKLTDYYTPRIRRSPSRVNAFWVLQDRDLSTKRGSRSLQEDARQIADHQSGSVEDSSLRIICAGGLQDSGDLNLLIVLRNRMKHA
jgi:hypothetical protein